MRKTTGYVILKEDRKTTERVDYKKGQFYNYIYGFSSYEDATIFDNWDEAKDILYLLRLNYPYIYLIERKKT